ncbi:methyl-accepting chemotaxis protein [Ferdinandcohnia quinoae]|uniref:Methyl-accepting chemotaxis protein n=1 Tax=Fredinandcohnia quinoae TaxID=2918902 RepID=A0AAW5E699_9BACI|nr:methyl-accepting chemotaxis protein [Fredinandcohnia sp. SECRCQ15]MCH1626404.1 methyl-accepting chemotaxis protein [Fredinandcohnia sp. SECRCQ15]
MALLRNLKVSRKLLLLLIISALSLIIVGVIGINSTKKMAEESESMYNNTLQPNMWLGQVRINNRALGEYTLQLMLTTDPKENEEIKRLMKESIDEINLNINQFKEIKLSPENSKNFEAYLTATEKVSKSRGEIINLAIENKNEEAYQLYKQEVEKNIAEVNNALSALQQSNLVFAENQNEQNKKDLKTENIILVSVIVLTLLLLITLGLIITRVIVNPINSIKELLAKAEQGDFTVEGSYQSKDELGVLTISFNNMIIGLKKIIAKVGETSHQVAAASEELTASAGQTTTATENVAVAIQEIASGADTSSKKLETNSTSLKGVHEGVLRITDRTTNVAELSRSTAKDAEEGSEIVEQNLTQMKFIHQSVSKSNEVIGSLSLRSNEIGKILDVIGGIADQTNLLALNAAIEAARAGEHGKGFAVVANEVKKLAEESLSSTKIIADLIGSIQQDTNESVKIMSEVKDNAERGMAISTEASEKFNLILGQTRNITPQIEDITQIVLQISESIESISTASNQITLLAKQNAANSEDVAAATEEQLASMEEINSSSQALAFMAEELNELVSRFKI